MRWFFAFYAKDHTPILFIVRVYTGVHLLYVLIKKDVGIVDHKFFVLNALTHASCIFIQYSFHAGKFVRIDLAASSANRSLPIICGLSNKMCARYVACALSNISFSVSSIATSLSRVICDPLYIRASRAFPLTNPRLVVWTSNLHFSTTF